MYCTPIHRQRCHKCEGVLKVTRAILTRGYCTLSDAFSMAKPDTPYCAERARSFLLQIGNPSSGRSFSFLIEKCPMTDYAKMGNIINGLAMTFSSKDTISLL